MKNKIIIALATLALGASAFVASAQDADGPPPGDGSNGPGKGHHRPPPSPVMMALDVNHDGVIDADEIANAPAELKTLDKNGDGKLTQEELRPARPPGPPPAEQGDNAAPNGPPPQQ